MHGQYQDIRHHPNPVDPSHPTTRPPPPPPPAGWVQEMNQREYYKRPM